jgi:hypothetical protein
LAPSTPRRAYPHLRSEHGKVQTMEGYTEAPQIPVVYEADLLGFFARYGVGDLVGVEATEDRVVQLSPRSELACPLHGLTALPDACRSCRFLAGEVR